MLELFSLYISLLLKFFQPAPSAHSLITVVAAQAELFALIQHTAVFVESCVNGCLAAAAADGFYIIQMKQVIDETATADKKEELLSEKEQELLDKKFEEWGKDESFDYDKDVNWEYMKEIDFVANSSVTATTSEETATMEEKEDTSASTTEEDTTTQE